MSFQAWDWPWYLMLWSQKRNSGAHGAENSIQISALAGVEPRTLASIAAADIATRLPRTPPFSRLLRHAGSYSRTILTPNLQGVDNRIAKVLYHIYISHLTSLISPPYFVKHKSNKFYSVSAEIVKTLLC